MIHNKIRSLAVPAVALTAAALLAGCVTPVPVYQTRYPYQPAAAPVYPAAPAYNQAVYVETGIVANIEVLRSETPPVAPSGGGAVVGGLVGGVLGNQIGHGSGRAAATMLGVVGGALAGNAVEARNGAGRVYESYRVSVQMSNGSYRSFDVPSPGDLRIGDRVRIDGGQISRY
ncbi:glycine zipper 2TM protein [Pseudacidovorax intermedius]|uniref:Glycine zipper 2TM protein n=1 Tax=Pseudacidovorax intermedius TaxID=433924 RepID=A0A370FIP4_9BURK|nr:glycine zipper 2TM protein [Pseudacidovorax intermedius]